MRLSQKRDYSFLDAAFTNMYSTMANFYDYYVSNDSEENEGQAKAARMDFKTRSRDKRSENESPSAKVQMMPMAEDQMMSTAAVSGARKEFLSK